MEDHQGDGAPRAFRELLDTATPHFFVTPVLVGLNVAFFAVMVLFGVSPLDPDLESLWRFGANFGPRTFAGEWWRILSSTFVHIGFFHLVLNMWALWSLGNLAERMFGSMTFLVIYLMSGIGGSVGTLLWHPHITSAGASGALFGVLGALVAFVYLGHIHVPPRIVRNLRWVLIAVVVFNLLFGFMWPRIDNAGHLGGLLVGLITGAALHRPLPVRPRSALRYLAVPMVLAVLAGLAELSRALAQSNPSMLAAEALELELQGKSEAAAQKLEQAIEMDPGLVSALTQLGYLHLEAGRFGAAATVLEKAAQLEPDSVELHVVLGIAYMRDDRYREAAATLEKALERAPGRPALLSELGTAQYLSGDSERGVESLRKAIELDPENSEHHNRLALVLAESGDGEGSLEAIEAALDLAPRAAHIWDSLGTVRLYRNEPAEAAEAYRKAIQLDPQQAIYHYNLSLALRRTGAMEAADEARTRALELAPDLEPPSDGSPMIWS
ncbi:MAG TPA: rhomboid family intramembrane serine protease [Vicinamibacteria bacterium]|nr:rhomboid family intramembrane serine protease [Vicinamibacteria bacterium]